MDSIDIFQPYDVPPDLLPYVKRLLVADCQEPVSFTSPAGPTGTTFFGWHYRGALSIQVNDDAPFSSQTDYLSIAGQLKDENIIMGYEGNFGHALVQFSALGLYQMMGIEGQFAYGRQFDIDTCGEEMINLRTNLLATRDRLGESVSGRMHLELMLDTLRQRLPSIRKVPDALAHGVDVIDQAQGGIHVNDVCETVGVSQKQLARMFIRIVGLHPKYYCRILQINRALEALLQNDGQYLADIASKANFYDQSHFNRVFREFLATSPLEFIRSDETMLFQFLGNKWMS